MKLYKLVQKILDQYPETCSDDYELIWSIWQELGLVKNGTISKEDFKKSYSIADIPRARRMVQSDEREKANRFGLEPRWQPNPVIKMLRKHRQEEKGTHVYREEI